MKNVDSKPQASYRSTKKEELTEYQERNKNMTYDATAEHFTSK